MNPSRREPGIYVSGAAHLALLLSAFVVFSDAKPLEAPQESTPVDILTEQQFNQIMKGEKQATEKKPAPPKADKIADVEEKKPTPPVVAKTDTPTPPPPLKRQPDPADDDTPEPPKRVAALPPPTPAPVVPTPPRPELRPTPPKAEKAPEPPPRPDAEAIEPPKPPTRPTPPKVEKPPTPPKVERTPTPPAPPTPPKEEARPKPDAKPLDRTALAKLLDAQKPDETARPAARPRASAETSDNQRRLDSAALSKLLSHEDPGARPATGRVVNQTASIGAPNANAPKMSPSLWGQLDALMQEQYKKCWSYLGLSGETHYIPQIKVAYDVNGALVGQPALLNPPGDPNIRSLADSALRAVRRCNPLRIPAEFAPYFQQWKERILRFDPEEMAG